MDSNTNFYHQVPFKRRYLIDGSEKIDSTKRNSHSSEVSIDLSVEMCRQKNVFEISKFEQIKFY